MALPLNVIHSRFSTQVCVCVFSQSSKVKIYLWENISKPGPLFKKPKHDRKCFANPRVFWSSSTIMQTISRLPFRQWMAGALLAVPSLWSLGQEPRPFDWVLQPCHSNNVPGLGPKRHQQSKPEHTFSTHQWWQQWAPTVQSRQAQW